MPSQCKLSGVRRGGEILFVTVLVACDSLRGGPAPASSASASVPAPSSLPPPLTLEWQKRRPIEVGAVASTLEKSGFSVTPHPPNSAGGITASAFNVRRDACSGSVNVWQCQSSDQAKAYYLTAKGAMPRVFQDGSVVLGVRMLEMAAPDFGRTVSTEPHLGCTDAVAAAVTRE